MQNKNLQNLLRKVNTQINISKQSESELTILNNELSHRIKGGCETKCKPNDACNGNNHTFEDAVE